MWDLGKGESLKLAVTKCECEDKEEKEEEWVVQLSPTRAPRPQTLKKQTENNYTNGGINSIDPRQYSRVSYWQQTDEKSTFRI